MGGEGAQRVAREPEPHLGLRAHHPPQHSPSEPRRLPAARVAWRVTLWRLGATWEGPVWR